MERKKIKEKATNDFVKEAKKEIGNIYNEIRMNKKTINSILSYIHESKIGLGLDKNSDYIKNIIRNELKNVKITLIKYEEGQVYLKTQIKLYSRIISKVKEYEKAK
jgi:hypothetical protein